MLEEEGQTTEPKSSTKKAQKKFGDHLQVTSTPTKKGAKNGEFNSKQK